MTVLVISLRRLALEEDRNQVLQGTLAIQKCFRGHHARRHFHELKGGVIKLQSFIRGEISRRKHCALLKLNEHVAYGMPNKQRISVVKIQLDKDFLFVNVFGVLVVYIVLTPYILFYSNSLVVGATAI
ncbi:myosin-2-like isoform X1 [Olea europaea subsp. europaea]|uniref:Myosin-2-like isoform X1 n=1 Tax=Olea europaea subsp. europaea TaxID=158383 RepID=A0A8S0SD55_OLEEU|nr:myosin-2-like isoform X1 [Olea europaea subsp. europaea]